MRTASRWLLVSVVALSVGSMALAQQPGGGRGGRGGAGQPGGRGGRGMMGGIMLLSNEAVQKELKVTDEQKEKLKTFAEEQGQKLQEKMREARDDAAGDPQKMMDAMTKVNAEAMKTLADSKILDEKQLNRFKQVELQVNLQRQGPAALAGGEVAKTLKVSDEQKEKLRGLAEEFRKDRTELGREAFGNGEGAADARKKLQTVTKEYMAKATDVLNSDQKKELKEMTGEHFEMPQGRPQGGQGGNRRRPGGNNPPPPPV
jgi:Spy/CpxP family protein refolding chaperone/predicted transcriptional regulator